jgi:hypothetical protein
MGLDAKVTRTYEEMGAVPGAAGRTTITGTL